MKKLFAGVESEDDRRPLDGPQFVVMIVKVSLAILSIVAVAVMWHFGVILVHWIGNSIAVVVFGYLGLRIWKDWRKWRARPR